MAITFVNEAHAQSYYTGTVTVTKPTGTANDDLLIAVVGGTRSGSTPAGWSPLSSVATPAAGSLGTVYVYYKIAASEGANYTFPHSGTAFDAWASISAYRGVDTSTPVDTTHYAITAKSATATYATASTTADGTQWAFTFAMQYTYGGASGGTWTESSGSERADQNNFQSSESASYSIADSNGVVGAGAFTRTHTCAITTSGGACGTVLINPAGITVDADAASVTATANSPTVTTGRAVSASQASVSATANAATVTVINVNANQASAAATAYSTTVTIVLGKVVNAATASAATTAYDITATKTVAVEDVGDVSVVATANDIPVGLGAVTENATVAVSAFDATVEIAKTVNAGQASSAATANSTMLAITSTADDLVAVEDIEALTFSDVDVISSVDDLVELGVSSSSADTVSLLDDGSAFEVAIIDKSDTDIVTGDDGIEMIVLPTEGDIVRVVSRH